MRAKLPGHYNFELLFLSETGSRWWGGRGGGGGGGGWWCSVVVGVVTDHWSGSDRLKF